MRRIVEDLGSAEEQGHFHHVDIEVSDYEYYTSDEDTENKFGKQIRTNTIAKSFFGRSSFGGPLSNEAVPMSMQGSLTKSKKKRQDQL